MNNLIDHENLELNQSLQRLRDDLVDESLEFNEDVKAFSNELIQLSRAIAIEKIDDIVFREILLREATLFEKRRFLALIKPLRALNQKNFHRQIITETNSVLS